MNTQEVGREEIARLAYQLWEERGCPVGSPELDWERAEKALRQQASSDTAGDRMSAPGGVDFATQSTEVEPKTDSATEPRANRRSRTADTGRGSETPRRSTR